MAEPDLFQNFVAANTPGPAQGDPAGEGPEPQGILGVNIMVALSNFADW